MIVQKNFLNKLKDFGLNTYESKLWTALLSRGVSTAGELSDIANVPRSRSYDVLESLEKKGFIVMKLGKPIKYLAVPPAEVIERVKKRVSEEASRHGELLESLRGSKILEELNTLHQQGSDRVEPTEMTAHVKGWSNLVDHLESMIKGATSSIDIITSETGLQGKAELIKRHAAKDKKPVRIRILTQNTKKSKQIADELKDLAEVRFSDINARIALADGKHATMMLLPHQTAHPEFDTGIWVNSSFLTGALQSLFEQAWNTAQK